MQRETDEGWGGFLRTMLLVLAGIVGFHLLVWLAVQAPLVAVPLAAGAYGLWRWHRRDAAAPVRD